MNPNSTHQLWSRWIATITAPFHQTHAQDAFSQEMRSACARFYRTLFGSATELKITREFIVATGQSRFEVDCRTEGAPAPNPEFRQRQIAEIAQFFGRNLHRYGQVDVRVDVRIEAGDVGDGKPPAQLILGPPVALLPRMTLIGQ
jgi:hypothetical protein